MSRRRRAEVRQPRDDERRIRCSDSLRVTRQSAATEAAAPEMLSLARTAGAAVVPSHVGVAP